MILRGSGDSACIRDRAGFRRRDYQGHSYAGLIDTAKVAVNCGKTGAGPLAGGDRDKVHASRHGIRHVDIIRGPGREVIYSYGVGQIVAHLDRVRRVADGQS